MPKRLRKILIYPLLALVCAGLAWKLQFWALGDWVEHRSYDLRFRLRGALPPLQEPPLVILAVDDASFDEIPDPFMLWQRHFGQVIAALAEAQAAVVGIDFVFVDIGQIDPEGQMVFLQSLLQAGAADMPVILAYRVRGDSVDQPPAIFTMAASEENYAYINLTTDIDDFVRRQELFSENEDGRLSPGFAHAIANGYLRRKNQDPEASLPTSESTILINYRDRHPFRQVSFSRALRAARDGDHDFLEKNFRGHIVLLGPVGDEDRHSTPLYYWRERSRTGQSMRTPGIEIHGHTIATLLEGNAIRKLSNRNQILLTFLMVALVVLLCFRLSPVSAFLPVAD